MRCAVDGRLCAAEGHPDLLASADNAAEAAVSEGVRGFGLKHLSEVVAFLNQPDKFAPTPAPAMSTNSGRVATGDLREVRGQTAAKWALEVAAAGRTTC